MTLDCERPIYKNKYALSKLKSYLMMIFICFTTFNSTAAHATESAYKDKNGKQHYKAEDFTPKKRSVTLYEPGIEPKVFRYTYDTLGRLITVSDGDNQSTYQHDKAGNRTSKTTIKE